MRVVIAGGGIGGLACAQGLLRAGIDTIVVERDPDLALTGGYQLHFGIDAISALHAMLPKAAFGAVLRAAVARRGFALALRDHRGRCLMRIVEDGEELALDIDRIALRQALAAGLDGRLLLGRRCIGWQRAEDGVRVELDSGDTLDADVLVIADGAGSALAARLAGAPTSTRCGLVGIAGRTAWTATPSGARRLLTPSPMLAVGPGGTGLFASAHDPAGVTTGAAPALGGRLPEPVAIWGVLALEGVIASRLADLGQDELRCRAAVLLARRRWTAPLVGLIDGAEASSVAAFRLQAAAPERVAPWQASRVTALGDAAHAMPPTGGQGAATAVLDARELSLRLAEAADGGDAAAIVPAIAAAEHSLRRRGARAVRESLQPVRWIRATATPLGAAALRATTPLVAAVTAVATRVRPRLPTLGA